MSLTTVSEGDIVAAQFSPEENYYRARVTSVDIDTYDDTIKNVELFFVDFGDSESKSITEIFELKSEFLKLKYQAIPCSLANVRPESGSSWSDQAADLFCRLSHCALWKSVFVKLVRYNDDNIAEVEMIDTGSGQAEDVNIGAELVNEGVAKW